MVFPPNRSDAGLIGGIGSGGQALGKRAIVARAADMGRARYFFLGYRDDLDRSFPRWTQDRCRARWLDADEAEVEAKLLAARCRSHVICAEPLGAPSLDQLPRDTAARRRGGPGAAVLPAPRTTRHGKAAAGHQGGALPGGRSGEGRVRAGHPLHLDALVIPMAAGCGGMGLAAAPQLCP
ncbi:hypothetical protein [Siccirubricoccus phaeus]|uniref:hypothetical protein n=1 Tax=Siccirubricoccus phaeus TaxID=2595053 RepID=UPI0011F3023E|nr:hypothetical protein [Siccirubricoccus phaeus]